MNRSRQEDGETVSNRQVGYGLVFGVPKSLSIYLAITGDKVAESIARLAVDETMEAMESEMQCKVRKGGLQEDRRTGELLYSMFFHRDSRPIDGLTIHWHVHCFLHNATFDPVENRWKAGQFRGLITDKGYFQEYFHTLLAQRLMDSGYKLRRTDRGWHQRGNRRQRKNGGLRARSVIARQPNFSTVRRRSRTGVSKWERSGGTRSRRKARKRGLNLSCRSIRARWRSRPTSPSIPLRATGC